MMSASTLLKKEPARATTSVLDCPGSVLFNIKRIVVPVDFSECSDKALLYAVQFAKEFGATLDVLYVSPPLVVPVDFILPQEYDRMHHEALSQGEQKLACLILESVPQGIPAESIVRCGRPATEIVDVAAEVNADLIIIGTHGRTGLRQVLLGSTAEEVVRNAPCPVLTVREKEHEFLAE